MKPLAGPPAWISGKRESRRLKALGKYTKEMTQPKWKDSYPSLKIGLWPAERASVVFPSAEETVTKVNPNAITPYFKPSSHKEKSSFLRRRLPHLSQGAPPLLRSLHGLSLPLEGVDGWPHVPYKLACKVQATSCVVLLVRQIIGLAW